MAKQGSKRPSADENQKGQFNKKEKAKKAKMVPETK
jgi:hypothetical protein